MPLDVLIHCICIYILVSANTLENVCEKLLTHVHKVIHLVVSIFEQGWRSLSSGDEVLEDRTLGLGLTGPRLAESGPSSGWAAQARGASDPGAGLDQT